MTRDPQQKYLFNCIECPLKDQNYIQILLHANNSSDNVGLTLFKKYVSLSVYRFKVRYHFSHFRLDRKKSIQTCNINYL